METIPTDKRCEEVFSDFTYFACPMMGSRGCLFPLQTHVTKAQVDILQKKCPRFQLINEARRKNYSNY